MVAWVASGGSDTFVEVMLAVLVIVVLVVLVPTFFVE